MKPADVQTAALKLPPHDRAELATRLLESLEALSDAEVEALWADEAARRAEELRADPTQARPGDDVMREARARVR